MELSNRVESSRGNPPTRKIQPTESNNGPSATPLAYLSYLAHPEHVFFFDKGVHASVQGEVHAQWTSYG